MQQDTQLRDVTEGSPWGDTRMGAESRSPRALEPWTASTRYRTQKQLLRVRAEHAAHRTDAPVLPSAAARLGVDGSRIRRSGTGAVLGN